MGDIGESFKQLNEHRKKKRANNREYSTNLLTERGVVFTSHNDGTHLIITHKEQKIDFWPSTGKFIFRMSSVNGRGVRNLLKKMGEI